MSITGISGPGGLTPLPSRRRFADCVISATASAMW